MRHYVQTIYVELEMLVEFDYTPGRPGRNYMPNGDPGYPDEPAEFDVTDVTVIGRDNKPLFKLTDEQIKALSAWYSLEEAVIDATDSGADL